MSVENPPAYPLVRQRYEMHGQQFTEYDSGMTLLDYFAGQALAGSYASGYGEAFLKMAAVDPSEADRARALHAYKVAAQMLSVRQKYS